MSQVVEYVRSYIQLNTTYIKLDDNNLQTDSLNLQLFGTIPIHDDSTANSISITLLQSGQ